MLAAAILLGGCSSVIDSIPTAMGGLPSNAPERRATPGVYPAVHEPPPNRGPTVLSEAERKRLREDLVATRERAARDAAANPDATTTGATPPAGAPPRP